MLRSSLRVLALVGVLASLGAGVACSTSSPQARAPDATHAFGGVTGGTTDRFTMLAGVSGAVVVPVGSYVTSVRAHTSATDSGTAASIAITPSGRYNLQPCNEDGGPYDAAAVDASACALIGATIPLGLGDNFEIRIPVLRGAPDELGEGTTFIFTGTDSYVLTLVHFGP
jgi:hypothetical protein